MPSKILTRNPLFFALLPRVATGVRPPTTISWSYMKPRPMTIEQCGRKLLEFGSVFTLFMVYIDFHGSRTASLHSAPGSCNLVFLYRCTYHETHPPSWPRLWFDEPWALPCVFSLSHCTIVLNSCPFDTRYVCEYSAEYIEIHFH